MAPLTSVHQSYLIECITL